MTTLTDSERKQLGDTYVVSQHSGFPISNVRSAQENGHVVLMDVDLFRYIYGLTKTLLPLLLDPLLVDDLDFRSIRLVRERARAAARIAESLIKFWRLVFFGEKTKRFRFHKIFDHPKTGSFEEHLLMMTVANLEQFVIAHEVAHILLGHTGPTGERPCSYLGNVLGIGGAAIPGVSRRDEEFRADELALDLVLRTTTKQRRFMNMESSKNPGGFDGFVMR
jgi:hypothetical protein